MEQRLTAPSSTDKNYLHYTRGGHNYCIKINGGPSVLPNCVGYAWGRANEILGVTFNNLSRGNAEVWWGKTSDGFKRGQTPKQGAVMCWRKGSASTGSDGAGHVAIVEEVYSNGDVLISESAYGGYRFRTRRLKKGYNLGGTYHFQGFIYLLNDTPKPQPKPPVKKTNAEIAAEVKRGLWGNGADRKKRLEAAGYNYSTIQAIVNGQSQPKPPVKKTNEQIATEVKLGLWGNGADRKKRLEAAGYNYGAIQAIVNGGSTATIKVGDTVKVLRAVQYNGKPFRVWTNKYTVSEIKGDRAVIKQGSTTIAAVNIKDLQKI